MKVFIVVDPYHVGNAAIICVRALFCPLDNLVLICISSVISSIVIIIPLAIGEVMWGYITYL